MTESLDLIDKFLDRPKADWHKWFGDPAILAEVAAAFKLDFRQYMEEAEGIGLSFEGFLRSPYPRVAGWFQTPEIWGDLADAMLREFKNFRNDAV